jgi:uncharacterized protein (DUF1501 family)
VEGDGFELPTIAIGRPGTNEGALPLDGRFDLHPALASLLPLWNDKKLAFIHAAGSPDPTRSHFDAQLFIENGTPGRSTTADGWSHHQFGRLDLETRARCGCAVCIIYRRRLSLQNELPQLGEVLPPIVEIR